MNDYYRIIPLGGDCGVAGSLRKIGYKEKSYCFDWVVSNLDFIIESFETEFKIFENLFLNCKKSGNGKLKYNNSIYFYHDDNTVSDNLKNKYINRSKRLHTLLSEIKEKKILFIRKGKNNSVKDVTKLKNIIINNYPDLKFKILLVNNIRDNSYSDEHIIHKYYSEDCFLTYCETEDIYRHSNTEKAYQCIYDELKNINTEKFIQPSYRDAY
jgi:hypothetical protein